MYFSKTSYFLFRQKNPHFCSKKPRSASALFAKFPTEELSSGTVSFVVLKISETPYSVGVHRNSIFNKNKPKSNQAERKYPYNYWIYLALIDLIPTLYIPEFTAGRMEVFATRSGSYRATRVAMSLDGSFGLACRALMQRATFPWQCGHSNM